MSKQKVPYVPPMQVFYFAAFMVLLSRMKEPLRFSLKDIEEVSQTYGLRTFRWAEKDAKGDLLFEGASPKFCDDEPFEVSLEFIPTKLGPELVNDAGPGGNVLSWPVQ